MRFGRAVLALSVLLVPATARAHKHNMEAFGGVGASFGSPTRFSAHLSGDRTIGSTSTDPDAPRPWSLVGDLVYQQEGETQVGMPAVGLRYSRGTGSVSVFGQALLGLVEWATYSQPRYGIVDLGAGITVEVSKGFALRLQADVIFSQEPSETNPGSLEKNRRFVFTFGPVLQKK